MPTEDGSNNWNKPNKVPDEDPCDFCKQSDEFIHNEDGNQLEPTSNKLMVDPHGFEGDLKMVVEVPDSQLGSQ
ncbi:hypothetical protein Tco_1334868 [Tanacetum coccineum]